MIKSIHFKNKPYGSITIFLSIAITLILAVIFSFLESARAVCVKTNMIDTSTNSMYSLFGSYCEEIFDKYGIFVLNEPDINVTSFLQTSTKDNISSNALFSLAFGDSYNLINTHLNSITITEKKYITDNDGKLFERQAISFMKYMEIDSLKKQYSDSFGLLKNSSIGIDLNDTSIDFENINSNPKTEFEIDEDYDDTISSSTINESLLTQNNNRSSLNLNVDNSPTSSTLSNNIALDNAVDFFENTKKYLSHLLRENLMDILVDDIKKISSKKINKMDLPSITTTLSEGSSIPSSYLKKNIISLSKETIWLVEYISYLFSSYVSKEYDKALDYEIEYILIGDDSDFENLYNTCIKLVFLRASFNSAVIICDEEKRNKISNLTSSICYDVPLIKEATEFTLLTIWSVAEGIIDVKDLLSGKKVPLIKNSTNWTLDLYEIPTLNKTTVSKNPGDDGQNYNFYLKLLLLASSNLCLDYRAMDIIQLNICNAYNTTFRMKDCICGVSCEFSFSYKPAFINIISIFNTSIKNEFTIPQTFSYS